MNRPEIFHVSKRGAPILRPESLLHPRELQRSLAVGAATRIQGLRATQQHVFTREAAPKD